jgi:hypothetical protein
LFGEPPGCRTFVASSRSHWPSLRETSLVQRRTTTATPRVTSHNPLEQISDTSKLEANAIMLNQYIPMFYSEVKLYSQRLMKLQNRVLAPDAMVLSRWPAEHLDQRSLSTNDFSSVSYPSVVLACFFLLIASLIVTQFLNFFSQYPTTLIHNCKRALSLRIFLFRLHFLIQSHIKYDFRTQNLAAGSLFKPRDCRSSPKRQ